MWKRIAYLAAWLLLVVVMQGTVVPALGWLRFLDLFLVLTAAVALLHGPGFGAGFGLVAGFLRDIALGFSLGFNVLPLFVIGYGIGQLSRVVFRDSLLVPFLAGIAGGAVYWVMMSLANGFLHDHWLSGGFIWQAFWAVFLNGLIVPVIYSVLDRQGTRWWVKGRG